LSNGALFDNAKAYTFFHYLYSIYDMLICAADSELGANVEISRALTTYLAGLFGNKE
jgi:hypothetical protein